MRKGELSQLYVSNILVVDNFDNLESIFADFLETLTTETLETKGRSEKFKSLRQQVQWLGDAGTSFGIDEVRNLQEQLSYGRPETEEWWYLIRNGDEISLPAQHALLKMLEEPPAQTHLCIITTKPELLLPTILSRCVTIKLGKTKNPAQEDVFQNKELFQKVEQASISDLIDLAEQFKEKSDAYQFLINLQTQYYEQLKRQPDSPRLVGYLESIQNTLNLLQTNVNIRILIEQTLFKIKQNIQQ